eukprot:2712583-Prymnesium_polylepis.2
MNEAEAHAVRLVLDALLNGRGGGARLRPSEVGIVTPYKAQERLLLNTLQGADDGGDGAPSSAEVATIDSFQGREKEVIILSCVRANVWGHLGFLADRRRMNVALTRARRGLVVLGHPPTLNLNGTVWSTFCEWAGTEGVVLPIAAVRAAVDG